MSSPLRQLLGLHRPPARGGVVVVTGASTGIGRATALRLAADGWRVLAGIRKEQDGAALVSADARIEPLQLDITVDDQIDAAAEAVAHAAPGGLAGLVNNAGIGQLGPVEALRREDWHRILDVNLVGATQITRALLPSLVRGGGRVVNVGSAQGRVSLPLFAPYAASKWGMVAFSDALRREVGPAGVAVALVEPGATQTPAFDKGLPDARARVDAMTAEQQERYRPLTSNALRAADETQAGDGIAPEDVAAVISGALTSRRLHRRYPVGTDARQAAFVGRLPRSLQDEILRRVTTD